MLHEQMSQRQFESVLDDPRNLYLNFCQNRVINSLDIPDIEFLCVGVLGGGVVIFISNPSFVILD